MAHFIHNYIVLPTGKNPLTQNVQDRIKWGSDKGIKKLPCAHA